jgi:hypothetical protein
MPITFSQLGQFGRLGNQLWEISTVISLALNNNDSYIFPTWKYEPYFNLHGCFSNTINYGSTYKEPHFHYAPIPYKQNLNLEGYFQSYKYLTGNEEIIKKLLTPKHNLTTIDITSIHCRRTDYLKFSQYHNVLDMNYYNQAIKLCPSNKYMIFSDDINWCKNNFKGDQFIFSEGKSEVDDLSLMISCKNNIIANSSFSWWGAFLNPNVLKKIIAPQKWFGPATNHNIQDLMPKEWIKC